MGQTKPMGRIQKRKQNGLKPKLVVFWIHWKMKQEDSTLLTTIFMHLCGPRQWIGWLSHFDWNLTLRRSKTIGHRWVFTVWTCATLFRLIDRSFTDSWILSNQFKKKVNLRCNLQDWAGMNRSKWSWYLMISGRVGFQFVWTFVETWMLISTKTSFKVAWGSQIFKHLGFPYYNTMYSVLKNTLIAGAHQKGTKITQV